MKQDKDDKKIKQLFYQLQQQDEPRTPSFARMWATATQSQIETRRQPILKFSFAVAMVLLLVIAGSAFVVYRQRQVDVFVAVDSITQWQSPTRSLLGFSDEKALPRSQRSLVNNSAGGYNRSLSNWQSPTASLFYPEKKRINK